MNYIGETIMAKYVNQKDIVSAKPLDVEAPYITISEKDFYMAWRTLKPTTVGIWIFLVKNKPDFVLGFSPKQVKELMGINEKTSKTAIKELEEKGYLEQLENGTYICYTEPSGEITDNDEIGVNNPHPRGEITGSIGVNNPHPRGEKPLLTSTSTSISTSTSTSKNGSQSSPEEEIETEEEKIDKIVNGEGRGKRGKTLADLTLDELEKMYEDYKNYVKFPVLYKKYDLARNTLANGVKLFETTIPKMIKDKKQDVFSDAHSQLATLQNLPLEDIRDVLSSSGIDLSKDYDIGYMFQGEEPEVRQQLKDRFNLSILFTDCEGEFCLRLMEYAQSGDKDKFIEDTKYWDTVKARR